MPPIGLGRSSTPIIHSLDTGKVAVPDRSASEPTISKSHPISRTKSSDPLMPTQGRSRLARFSRSTSALLQKPLVWRTALQSLFLRTGREHSVGVKYCKEALDKAIDAQTWLRPERQKTLKTLYANDRSVAGMRRCAEVLCSKIDKQIASKSKDLVAAKSRHEATRAEWLEATAARKANPNDEHLAQRVGSSRTRDCVAFADEFTLKHEIEMLKKQRQLLSFVDTVAAGVQLRAALDELNAQRV